MYTLNIARAIKMMSVNKKKTLSLKIIIKELNFLKKTIIIFTISSS